MGGGKGKRDADEAPQQNHAKPGSVSRKLAKGGLNECSHNCFPSEISGCGASLPDGPCSTRDRAGQGLLTWLPPHPSMKGG